MLLFGAVQVPKQGLWTIQMWAVYENPSDFPDKFVVRRWAGKHPDSEPLAVANTLEEARAAVPKGLQNIGRMRDDDPVLVEVWL